MNDEYDPSKPHSFITYLDANNLYSTAMSEPLPTGGFGFLDAEQMAAFDVMSIPKDSDRVYIVECDLEYPESLHELHSDYRMAPEHLTISKDMLSDFALSMIGKNWKPSQKLVPSLLHKTKYVCHYRNLQFYIRHGLVLKKIHRVIFFKQECWLEPWIRYCTEQRQAALTDFESDLAKLQANATFGKTMEQVRNRINLRLICVPLVLSKAVSRPSFRRAEIINDDLTTVCAAKQHVTLINP